MFKRLLGSYHPYVLISYLGITLLFTYPLLLNFSTHIPGDGCDGLIFFWNLWWFKKALLSLNTNPLFCNYIFYPIGTGLGLHSLAIFNGLFSLPFQFLFNLYVVYNIIVVFSFLFSAYGAYLLVNYLIGDKRAAFIAGIIFAFCPYKFAHLLGHMGLVGTEWIPFYVLYLIKMTKSNFSIKYSILAGIFMLLTIWCSYYYFIFLILFTFVYWVYLVITEKNLIINKIFPRKVALFSVVPLLGLLPILYSTFNDIVYGNYTFGGIGSYTEFVSDFLGFFTPGFFHPVFKKYVNSIYTLHFTGGIAENNVFIGYTILLIVFYGLLKFRSDCKKFKFWFYSGIFFFVLSLGPALHFYGKEYPVFLPAWIFRWIPIFSGVRGYSRFVIMGMLSLSVFAAYICHLIFQKVKYKSLTMLSLTFLISFEYLPAPYPLWKTAVPEIYKKISQEKEDFTILEIPLGWNITSILIGRPDIRHQFWQTVHNKRLLNGVISRGSITQADHFFEMPLLNKIYYLQEDIPLELPYGDADEKSIRGVIDFLNIKYIIIHSPYIGSKVHQYIQEELPVKLEKVAVGLPSHNSYERDEIVAFRVLGKKVSSKKFPGYGKTWKNFVQYKHGWYGSELWDNEFFMHWAKGRKSLLSAYLNRPGRYQIKMRAIPFPFGRSEQVVKIFINSKFLCKQKLMKGWAEYSIFVPETFLKSGENIIKFHYKSAHIPKLVYQGSEDKRQLAMGLDYIRIEKIN